MELASRLYRRGAKQFQYTLKFKLLQRLTKMFVLNTTVININSSFVTGDIVVCGGHPEPRLSTSILERIYCAGGPLI